MVDIKRPISDIAFCKVLESYLFQLFDPDVGRLFSQATIKTLESICNNTDPSYYDLSDFDDFIEEVVFTTYQCTLTKEGLNEFLLESINSEKAFNDKNKFISDWQIGDFFEHKGEIYPCSYQDERSFLNDVWFLPIKKIVQKSWDRSCKTEEIFPEDEAMNDRLSGFIKFH
tara:strand:+ start:44 stop:556 length:513 start_codon:yes stop_codon:yes gene_type:complete